MLIQELREIMKKNKDDTASVSLSFAFVLYSCTHSPTHSLTHSLTHHARARSLSLSLSPSLPPSLPLSLSLSLFVPPCSLSSLYLQMQNQIDAVVQQVVVGLFCLYSRSLLPL